MQLAHTPSALVRWQQTDFRRLRETSARQSAAARQHAAVLDRATGTCVAPVKSLWMCRRVLPPRDSHPAQLGTC
eukprot:365559-Chlamydomonas_euryale.AAC.7